MSSSRLPSYEQRKSTSYITPDDPYNNIKTPSILEAIGKPPESDVDSYIYEEPAPEPEPRIGYSSYDTLDEDYRHLPGIDDLVVGKPSSDRDRGDNQENNIKAPTRRDVRKFAVSSENKGDSKKSYSSKYDSKSMWEP